MALHETGRDEGIEDIQNNVDFSYGSWNPTIEVWRAGEGHERELPYIAVDYISTSDKKHASLADVVGRIDDHRYEYAYCETEVVTITIYTKKYHNSGNTRGRNYADVILKRIRDRIFAYWTDRFLYKYRASVDRGRGAPIRDLTIFDVETTTRIHEYELTVFLKTDVRWYRDLPQDVESEERAEKAYILINNKNNIRIDTS